MIEGLWKFLAGFFVVIIATGILMWQFRKRIGKEGRKKLNQMVRGTLIFIVLHGIFFWVISEIAVSLPKSWEDPAEFTSAIRLLMFYWYYFFFPIPIQLFLLPWLKRKGKINYDGISAGLGFATAFCLGLLLVIGLVIPFPVPESVKLYLTGFTIYFSISQLLMKTLIHVDLEN